MKKTETERLASNTRGVFLLIFRAAVPKLPRRCSRAFGSSRLGCICVCCRGRLRRRHPLKFSLISEPQRWRGAGGGGEEEGSPVPPAVSALNRPRGDSSSSALKLQSQGEIFVFVCGRHQVDENTPPGLQTRLNNRH